MTDRVVQSVRSNRLKYMTLTVDHPQSVATPKTIASCASFASSATNGDALIADLNRLSCATPGAMVWSSHPQTQSSVSFATAGGSGRSTSTVTTTSRSKSDRTCGSTSTTIEPDAVSVTVPRRCGRSMLNSNRHGVTLTEDGYTSVTPRGRGRSNPYSLPFRTTAKTSVRNRRF